MLTGGNGLLAEVDNSPVMDEEREAPRESSPMVSIKLRLLLLCFLLLMIYTAYNKK